MGYAYHFYHTLYAHPIPHILCGLHFPPPRELPPKPMFVFFIICLPKILAAPHQNHRITIVKNCIIGQYSAEDHMADKLRPGTTAEKLLLFFSQNPRYSYNAPTIYKHFHGKININTIRSELRRLHETNYLLRETHGFYRVKIDKETLFDLEQPNTLL